MSWSFWQGALLTLTQGTTYFALNWLVQSTLLILIGLFIARLLVRHGSAVQFVVYCTTLVAVLICPLLTSMLSIAGLTQWSLAIPLPSASQSIVQSHIAPASESVRDPENIPQKRASNIPRLRSPKPQHSSDQSLTQNLSIDHPEPSNNSESTIAPIVTAPSPMPESVSHSVTSLTLPWRNLVVVGSCLICFIWLSLSLWLLTRLGVAWIRLAAIRRQAIPAESRTIQICQELSQNMGVVAPSVMHTPFLPSPCLAGLIDPAVLLPEAELKISMYDVLIHELAHLRRRDGHWNLLRKVATGIFWFQPLLWFLSWRIELAAEEVCDDFVVEFGGDREEYAHRLVDVAEFSAVPIATAGVAMVSFRSMLAQRVARILDTSRRLSTQTSRGFVTTARFAGALGTLIIGLLSAAPTMQVAAKQSLPAVPKLTVERDSRLNASVDPFKSTLPAHRANDSPILNPSRDADKPAVPGDAGKPAVPGWQMFSKNPGTSAENVCWSPDGRLLAIAIGPIVRIFDFQQGTPEFKLVLSGHDDTVNAVRFDRQGSRLATASHDGTVRIWDTDGRQRFMYRGHEDAVKDVSWHPDGIRLASASLDGTVRIWTTEGKTLVVMRDHDAPVNAVAWNPNGKLLASGCENKIIRFWNDDGSPGPIVQAHVGTVKSLAWNFDGSKLLSCDYGIEASAYGEEDLAHMKIWDTSGRLVHSMLVGEPLSHVSWSPDGKRVAAGSWRNVKLWTIGDRQTVSRWYMNLNGVVPVAWRPTGEMIAAGPLMLNGMGIPQNTIPLRNVSLNGSGLNPGGTLLGIGRADATFDIFNTDGKQLYHSRQMGNQNLNQVHSICWSPDGKTLIPGMRALSNLQRYDTEGRRVGVQFSLPGDARSVAWSKDGRYVAAGGDNQVVSLVDTKTFKSVPIGRHQHGITQVRFTPDQQQVCSAGFDNCVRFWSLDGKPLKVFETISAPIDSLAWAGDGQLMVTGHQDNTIRFWSGEGELLSVVGGHAGHVEVLEFNPAGTLLASGSRDNSIRIWKRDGTLVSVLHGHSGTVHGIQWTPDGKRIYSCGADGVIRCWNVESGTTEWQAIMGETGGHVTIDAFGRVKSGNENILESDFVYFVEDHQGRLVRTNWKDVRAAASTQVSARVD